MHKDSSSDSNANLDSEKKMKCQNIFLFVAAIFSIEQVALPLN
jgi:hypothetical protein